MSVIIIIGGSTRAKSEVDQSNQDASQNNWTAAQKQAMADLFNSFADTVDAKRAEYNNAAK